MGRCVLTFIVLSLFLEMAQIGWGMDFEQAQVGTAPEGFKVIRGDWKVKQLPDKKHGKVLEAKGNSFQSIIVWTKKKYHDVEVEVDTNIVGGTVDPTAGIVVGFTEYNNSFYVCRVNPLEHNLVIWKIQGNSRVPRISAKTLYAQKNSWGRLGVKVVGKRLVCYFNQNGYSQEIDFDVYRYHEGYIGFWIKADAHTYFDNLKIKELK